jgi:hypothetical protein
MMLLTVLFAAVLCVLAGACVFFSSAIIAFHCGCICDVSCVATTGVGLLCAAIWCSFPAMAKKPPKSHYTVQQDAEI